MRRRTLLRAAPLACLPLAGCTGDPDAQQAAAYAPRAHLRMEPVSDAAIARHVLRSVEAGERDAASVLEQATTGESATTETTRPPLRDGRRVVYDGTVYRVHADIEDRTPATVYPVKINPLEYDGVTTAAGEREIAFSDLPEPDREQFAELGYGDGMFMGIGTTFLYPDATVEQSVLVPDPEYNVIVFDGDRRARFTRDGDAWDESVKTYRYTVERVSSAAEFGRSIRTDYAVDLTDLPDDQAAILATAADSESGYTVDRGTTPSASFLSLADRFADARDVTDLDETEEEGGDPRLGTYVVSVDGESYWTSLVIRDPTTTDE